MIQIDENLVYKFYEYFYKKKHNQLSYKFKPSDKAKALTLKFIKKLDKHYNLKTIGEEFLWNYFVYQFNYWRNAELKAFYGKFRIDLIIGDKAFKRFKDDQYDNMWVTYGSEIIDLYGLRKHDLIHHDTSPKYKTTQEESIKLLHLNEDIGFLYCIENTTLYNYKHKACLMCNFKDECKKILKEKYPKIYERRGY